MAVRDPGDANALHIVNILVAVFHILVVIWKENFVRCSHRGKLGF